MRASALCLALLAAALAVPGTHASEGVLPLVAARAGFEPALTAREFVFPADHGPHPAFQHEWWYLTGHLVAATGERFGFELTFFRVALGTSAARAPQAGASRWRAQQIYFAHFAVTDIGRGQFHSAERSARGALGLAGAEVSPLRVWAQDWSLAAAGEHWQIRAAEPGYALTLTLTDAARVIANGDQGLSQKSGDPRDASYYYSIPSLLAHGELVRDGQALRVDGRAWLDREWGSGALGAGQSGWDWFACQLSDGSALMFYSLRRSDAALDPHSAGTWVGADGGVRALGSHDVEIAVQSFWTSPRGGRYPARWKLIVPALSLTLELTPVLADQELAVRPRYWEGAVDITGARAEHTLTGEGYAELVGYAHAR